MKGPAVFLSFALLISSLTSCMPGQRIAKSFVRDEKKPALLLLFPDYIYKKNNKIPSSWTFKRLDSLQKDSVLYWSSRFIQYVNDSAFLSQYYSSLSNTLDKLGFETFDAQKVDTFFTLQSTSYVFSLAQLEIEEDARPYTDSKQIADSMVYYEGPEINILNMSSWFELTKVNDSDEPMKVLFSSFQLEDKISGDFFPHPILWEIKYKYTLDSLEPPDVYRLAEEAGVQDAEYLLDHLMNKAVSERYQGGMPFIYYFHYDSRSRQLRLANEPGFILIDPAEGR